MDKINELKKQLVEALLEYYIDQHNNDIAELEQSYTIYNQEMKKIYGENYWDTMTIPNSLKNTFFIKDRFVFENIYLINKYFKDWKIVKNNNEILMIKLID